jgi:hypothetical protein
VEASTAMMATITYVFHVMVVTHTMMLLTKAAVYLTSST